MTAPLHEGQAVTDVGGHPRKAANETTPTLPSDPARCPLCGYVLIIGKRSTYCPHWDDPTHRKRVA